MSLIEINWYPKQKELRRFAIIALIASLVVACLLYMLKRVGLEWALIIVSAGFAVFLSSFVSLKLTRIIYLGMVLVTFPIGWAISMILLTVFYFLLLTPLGLVFRLLGRDSLCRKFDPDAKTYWLARRQTDNLDRYFHQY